MRLFSIIPLAVAALVVFSPEASGQASDVWEERPHSMEISAGYALTLSEAHWRSDETNYMAGIKEKNTYMPVFLLGYHYRLDKRWDISVSGELYSSFNQRYQFPETADGGHDWNAEPQDLGLDYSSFFSAGMALRYYWVARPVWRMYSSLGVKYLFSTNTPSGIAIYPDISLLGLQFGKGRLYGTLDLMTFGPAFFVLPRIGLGVRL